MEHTISAAQFFAVQFLVRVTMTIALDPSAIAGENPLNTLLSYGLAMVLGAGLAVPVWLLHRQPGMAFGEQQKKFLVHELHIFQIRKISLHGPQKRHGNLPIQKPLF